MHAKATICISETAIFKMGVHQLNYLAIIGPLLCTRSSPLSHRNKPGRPASPVKISRN